MSRTTVHSLAKGLALMLPTDLVRVTLLWKTTAATWEEENAMTTFHLRYHQGDLPHPPFNWATEMDALPGQIYNKINSHWDPAFGPVIANTGMLIGITADHLAVGQGAPGTGPSVLDRGVFTVPGGGLTGDGGPSMLPPEVALAISWWSYYPGHLALERGRKRGRFYLPYIAANAVDGTGRLKLALQEATATGQQSFWNDVQGMNTVESEVGFGTDWWDFVTYSAKDATWHNVDYISIDNKMDSQRRRQHTATSEREIRTITHS